MPPALGSQCKPYREGLGADWLLIHRDLWKSFLSLLMSHVKKRIFLAQASPLPAPLLAGTSFPLPLLPPPHSLKITFLGIQYKVWGSFYLKLRPWPFATLSHCENIPQWGLSPLGWALDCVLFWFLLFLSFHSPFTTTASVTTLSPTSQDSRFSNMPVQSKETSMASAWLSPPCLHFYHRRSFNIHVSHTHEATTARVLKEMVRRNSTELINVSVAWHICVVWPIVSYSQQNSRI